MTQYYAVIDNQEFGSRSKWDADYLFYGTAKQAAEEVDRVLSRDGHKGVSVYAVKARPDFMNEDDLDPRKDLRHAYDQAQDKVRGLAEKLDLPQDKDAARRRFEELKAQAIQEGTQTATQIGMTLVAVYKAGVKDPQGLAKSAKTGLKAKWGEVRGRLTDFAETARDEAEKVEAEIKSDAVKTGQTILDRVAGPSPQAFKTREGQRYVRLAWLVKEGNAKPVTLEALRKAAAPKKRQAPEA